MNSLIKSRQLPDLAQNGTNLADLEGAQRATADLLPRYEALRSDKAEWDEEYDASVEAVRLTKRPRKDTPFTGASNVNLPIIAQAALEFNQNAYPALLNDAQIVKIKVRGSDPDGQKAARADRVARFMSEQVLIDMDGWEAQMDRLCVLLPAVGVAYKHITWDVERKVPATTLVSGRDMYVASTAKSLETSSFFARYFVLTNHELMERMLDGRYELDKDLQRSNGQVDMRDDERSSVVVEEDEYGPHAMVECHARLDLDGDGYEEPWIATFHASSNKLLSLRPGFWPEDIKTDDRNNLLRIDRRRMFVKYDFLPDPDPLNGFLGLGLGHLLRAHSDIINGSVNAMFDAARNNIAGGGFVASGVDFGSGTVRIEPGEWKMIDASAQDLNTCMVPKPQVPIPTVLFQLLGLMLDSARDISNIRDVLTGESPATATATTTIALIEQGLKAFNTIYRRIRRSLGQELRLVYDLNRYYLEEEDYAAAVDDPAANKEADFEIAARDIDPGADPKATTSLQQISRAQFLDGYRDNPIVDQHELLKRQFIAVGIPEPDKLLKKPSQAEGQAQQAAQKLSMQRAQAEIEKTQAQAAQAAGRATLDNVEAMNRAEQSPQAAYNGGSALDR